MVLCVVARAQDWHAWPTALPADHLRASVLTGKVGRLHRDQADLQGITMYTPGAGDHINVGAYESVARIGGIICALSAYASAVQPETEKKQHLERWK